MIDYNVPGGEETPISFSSRNLFSVTKFGNYSKQKLLVLSVHKWNLILLSFHETPLFFWIRIDYVKMLTFLFSSKGKLNRGLSVIDSYLLLKQGSEVTEDEFFLACVLGWCVEWVMTNDPNDTLIPSKFILFNERNGWFFCCTKKMQFQACALLLDDIMDGSHTRRDQICWYRRPEVLNWHLKLYFCEWIV